MEQQPDGPMTAEEQTELDEILDEANATVEVAEPPPETRADYLARLVEALAALTPNERADVIAQVTVQPKGQVEEKEASDPNFAYDVKARQKRDEAAALRRNRGKL